MTLRYRSIDDIQNEYAGVRATILSECAGGKHVTAHDKHTSGSGTIVLQCSNLALTPIQLPNHRYRLRWNKQRMLQRSLHLCSRILGNLCGLLSVRRGWLVLGR
jgi:hypothetical protein